jgi:Uncharacterized protein conserved in bacteria (DUF2334)
MRYVILRDDDTNAFTPVDCLERLYRPFLERALPVNLSVIPEVATDATMADGQPEGFLLGKNRTNAPTVAIGTNRKLVDYIRSSPGYHVLQHGCHHNYLEFDCPLRPEVARRLNRGAQCLSEAGFDTPQTFVAPYDKLSRAALLEVAARFRVLSSGWYELRRLPRRWWPKYALKKVRQAAHWQVGRTLLLTHPGCLLSYQRTYSTMLGGIIHQLNTNRLTVLVTHWWEYFRNGRPDEPFIDFLHETASYLATHPQLKVISFSDLVGCNFPLN